MCQVWRVSVYGGNTLLVVNAVIGVVLGWGLGMDVKQGAFVASCLSLSSTPLVVRYLDAESEQGLCVCARVWWCVWCVWCVVCVCGVCGVCMCVVVVCVCVVCGARMCGVWCVCVVCVWCYDEQAQL